MDLAHNHILSQVLTDHLSGGQSVALDVRFVDFNDFVYQISFSNQTLKYNLECKMPAFEELQRLGLAKHLHLMLNNTHELQWASVVCENETLQIEFLLQSVTQIMSLSMIWYHSLSLPIIIAAKAQSEGIKCLHINLRNSNSSYDDSFV